MRKYLDGAAFLAFLVGTGITLAGLSSWWIGFGCLFLAEAVLLSDALLAVSAYSTSHKLGRQITPLWRLMTVCVVVASTGLATWKPMLRYVESKGSHMPFPYIVFQGLRIDAEGVVQSVGLKVFVDDYPITESAKKGLASLSSLQNLNVTLSIPVAVRTNLDAHWSCVVGQIQERGWWNNDAGRSHSLGTVVLKKAVTVVELRSSAESGNWDGFLLLHRMKFPNDFEEEIRGHLHEQTEGGAGSSMSARVIGRGPHISWEDNSEPRQLTDRMLVDYGVPVKNIDREELNQLCTAIAEGQ